MDRTYRYPASGDTCFSTGKDADSTYSIQSATDTAAAFYSNRTTKKALPPSGIRRAYGLCRACDGAGCPVITGAICWGAGVPNGVDTFLSGHADKWLAHDGQASLVYSGGERNRPFFRHSRHSGAWPAWCLIKKRVDPHGGRYPEPHPMISRDILSK